MERCAICLNYIKEIGKINSCKHLFCINCITEWGKKNNTCPCCRGKFNVLSDSNDKLVDYFVDKENEYDLSGHDYYYNNIVFCIYLYIIVINHFDEKIPLVPYNRKLNKGSRYMDMGHYQRILA
tara:strand:+ start:366 stop:737 length:372 start_codon:yes stop_codon:yes gene_type:complete